MNPESTHHSPWLMPFAGQRNMFTYLPGEVIVHMCRYMDTYTLLKFGRCSSRLYNIVCSPEVWRRLLRGIEDYSEAKVRMLMLFARKGDFLNMMTEVLREISTRNMFTKGEDKVMLKVTIGGWCEAKTYDLCSDALRRLYMVEWESALVVPGGATMIVNEVKEFEGSKHPEIYTSDLGNHMRVQQSEVDLDSFEVKKFGSHWDSLVILRKCKTWLIHEFNLGNWRQSDNWTDDVVQRHWKYLASIADGGSIKMLLLGIRRSDSQSIYREIIGSLRKIWEISDNMKITFDDRSNIILRGGRNNENRDEHWQQLMEALQLGVS